jgi:outer membrane protein assembly factor BamD (BamD/ComL family)
MPVSAWIVAAVACGSGCSMLRSERDAVARYERTREELQRAARGELVPPGVEEAAREGNKPLSLGDFAPENVTGTVSRMAGFSPSAEEAEQLYREGKAVYDEAVTLRERNQQEAANEKFLAAADKFGSAAKKFPKSTVSQNGLFYAGEAFFFADHYVKANDNYERLLKEHPNSRHLDEVQRRRFAIAQYWLDMYRDEPPEFYEVNLTDSSKPWNSLFSNSMRVFDRIRLDDPTGNVADDATLAMATAYFTEERYGKADEYFTDLRRTFPSSEHQYTAHFVGLKAKLLTYQGPEYGGTVLDESEKLIQTMRKQFPVEAERDREYLTRAMAEVRFRKAEREYLMAEYFRAKAEYGAAKYYYSIVINDYSDTQFAERARSQTDSVVGLPEVPPQRFPWLVNAFPREERSQPLIATDKPKTKKR